MRCDLWAITSGVVLGLALMSGCMAVGGAPEGALGPGDAAVSAPRDLVLVPIPRTMALGEGSYAVPRNYSVGFAGISEAFGERIGSQIYRALDPVRSNVLRDPFGDFYEVQLRVAPEEMTHAEGYLLDIDEGGVRLVGHDEAGLFYGAMTLRQIARQCGAVKVFPKVHIEDWPDFPNRGVMIDVARDKVPEMRTLFKLIDLLAEWKFNQLQMYTEHSFAYRGHHAVWEDASPMTPAQIRRIDQYCRSRHIELVPNQNSFAHMGRWLTNKKYRHLAEMPGSGDLCPVDPGSIALLEDMYASLLPHFSSKQFNVGCDETWSLGKGRSKAAVEEKGAGRVYLDFLMQIYDLCQGHGRTMQFWGDIIMHHPELIPEIPAGVIAMEWGYGASHPFAEHGAKFAASGIPFYVVPGTSTWNSLAGRTENAVANLLNAAENGRAHGAIGYLITDWGDSGHWQFQPASYLGFAYGAGLAWACEQNKDMDLPRVLDVHAFHDSAGVMGRLAYDLGNAYKVCGAVPGNSTIFYTVLLRQLKDRLGPDLTAEGLEETIAYIDSVMENLPKADMAAEDGALMADEFRMTAALMRFACRLGIARLDAGDVGTLELPVKTRHRLAEELEPLLPEFRQLWLARNRGGGLRESVGRFERLLGLLKAD